MLRDFGLVTLIDLSVSLAGVLLVLPAVLALSEREDCRRHRRGRPGAPALLAAAAAPAAGGVSAAAGSAATEPPAASPGGRTASGRRRLDAAATGPAPQPRVAARER